MTSMRRGGAMAVALGLALGTVASARQTVSPTPVIVELFTSEGCSSCPPADALLIELAAQQPVKGARIIALSEHVDYWNQLGWKDPFSSAAFTRRQSDYAAAERSSDIYTPQMVVDGVETFVGSDRSAAVAAITHAAAVPKATLRLSWTAPQTLDVLIDANANAADATLFLAITEDGVASSVTRGENEGRRLTHGGVTRRLSEIGTTDHHGAAHASSSLVLDASWKRLALHVVVFAQKRGDPRIRAAGTIDLPHQ